MDFTNLNISLSNLTAYLPADLDFLTMLKFAAIFCACVLAIGGIGRVIAGKRSHLNHAVSATMGILFLYMISIVIYAFQPFDLQQLLAPLPFVEFQGSSLKIHALSTMGFAAACTHILSAILLSFLVNLLDTIIPKGERILSWFLFRILTVGCAFLLHYIVRLLLYAFLPRALTTYAPIVLLSILIILFALSILKLILGLTLAAINPILGAIYAFFFSNVIGKQISKALLTTVLLCVFFCVVSHLGYSVIPISPSQLADYTPFAAVLLLLWYLLGSLL